eukprot:m.139911 g.139911  ORF g.139911 m.139911 type:complete len:857 (-) comp9621_c0_seq5:187-2757(-)
MGNSAQVVRPPAATGSPGVATVRSHGVLATRAQFLDAARALRPSVAEKFPKGCSMLVLFNPMTNHNYAKQVVEETIRPMLEAAGIRVALVPSKFKGFAMSYFRSYDFRATAGVIACGGDTFINEVASGLIMAGTEQPTPLGIVPAGSVNMMAAHLAPGGTPAGRLAMQSTLQIIEGQTRLVDVMEVRSDGVCRHAIGVIGWGLPGTVGMHLDRQSWLPRRRRVPDTVELVSRVKSWTPARGVLAYPHAASPTEHRLEWLERNLGLVGLLATKLPKLGEANPICKAAEDDDGYIILTFVFETVPRPDVMRAILAMRKGKYFADNKCVQTLRVREFKLTPSEATDAPYILDGEPIGPGPVHVKVLRRRLRVFAQPHGMAVRDDAFKSSRVSLTLSTASDRDPLDETVSPTEVRKVLGIRQRRQMKRDAGKGDLLTEINGAAVEFINDEFDTENLDSMIARMDLDDDAVSDDGLAELPRAKTSLEPGSQSARSSDPAVLRIVRERTRVIQALAAKPGSIAPKHVTIIFNPVSGAGKAGKVVDQIVVPVLKAANVSYTIVPTQYRGFATEHVLQLDLSVTDGVVVCGGDGMVSEVITGLLQRKDAAARDFPVGIVAVGTANAMANHLDNGRAKNHVGLVSNAALAVARGHTSRVDVIEMTSRTFSKYALSCVGWGLAGAVGLMADKLRWVPGQKQARYDIAGAVTMLSDWPIVCRGQLSYPVTEAGPDGAKSTVWKSKNIGCINLIASNVPLLGNDHPICKDISAQDGKMAIALIDQSMSRTAVIKAALSMKRGNYLVESKYVESVITSEFKLMPLEGARGSDIPYNIDGDPVEPSSMHVKILNQRLRVYCLPRSGPLTV